jgi:nitrite reductase/ring-hydroxylating ferredoxin subunit
MNTLDTTTSPAVPLCASEALQEGGLAHVFDLLEHGQPARGFVLRFQGQVVGYLNQCAHVPAEMDWKAGQFLDDSGQWIICSIHGAVYEPDSGHCVGGPCRGRRLKPLQVAEHGGQVSWYPSGTLKPAFGD